MEESLLAILVRLDTLLTTPVLLSVTFAQLDLHAQLLVTNQ